MTEIAQKKISYDFPSGGCHFNAKNVKIGPKHLSCPVDSTVFILDCFDHTFQKAYKISKIPKKIIKIGPTVWI